MKHYLVFSLLVTTLMIAGCKNLEPSQVKNMSHSELCKEASEQFSPYNPNTKELIAKEVTRRGLDCSLAHLICTSYGFKKGTLAYGNCRIEQQRIEQQAISAAIMSSQASQQDFQMRENQQTIDNLKFRCLQAGHPNCF